MNIKLVSFGNILFSFLYIVAWADIINKVKFVLSCFFPISIVVIVFVFDNFKLRL
ncbi:hypothetical protein BDC45DRAFT_506674 [Circinella umbellata]|nr:hypothetical protein BDC45DRAFT_506674 [Circinella umbellata]